MKLSKIIAAQVPLTVEFAGETLRLAYRPGRITIQAEALIRGNQVGEALAPVIAEWDLEGEDGKSYPITAEAINALPVTLALAITEAILGDALPNETKASAP